MLLPALSQAMTQIWKLLREHAFWLLLFHKPHTFSLVLYSGNLFPPGAAWTLLSSRRVLVARVNSHPPLTEEEKKKDVWVGDVPIL